jgi:hypothetical protein
MKKDTRDVLAIIEERVQRQIVGWPMYSVEDEEEFMVYEHYDALNGEGWMPVYEVVVHIGEDLEADVLERANL